MIGIICGSGNYPTLIAQSCVEQNLNFCLVLLKDFANKTEWCSEKWMHINKVSIHFGEITKALDFLHTNNVKKIIFAGKVKKPNISQLSLDEKAKIWLIKLGKNMFRGDDTLLRTISNILEKEEGFSLISGTNFLNNIFLEEGIHSTKKPSESDLLIIDNGLQAAKKLGAKDIGQAVIFSENKLIATENENGTDNLLETYDHTLAETFFLCKASKPNQDLRLDLPTIGIKTIENAKKYGLKGIAIEANKCIVLNKNEVINRANELEIILISRIIQPKSKIFIIAGEPSGDYLGGKLIEDVQKKSDKYIEFFGIGGDYMLRAGLKQFFSINELSIMGIVEVISKIFHVKKLINKTTAEILKYKPDILLTIDSSGFTHRVNKEIKKQNPQIKIVHYVSPPIWAWRENRAKKFHKFIDKLLLLFPFETEYYKNHQIETSFVGHPIAIDKDFERPNIDVLEKFQETMNIKKNSKSDKIIIFLAGSRKTEIKLLLPVLEEFANLISNKYNVKIILPTINALEQEIKDFTKNWTIQPIIITKKSDKIAAYYSADIAIAASGTVTLELARVQLPCIIIYKTSTITYFLLKQLIKIKNISLINILAKKNVVPELLQKDCTAENILKHAEKIIESPEIQREQFYNIIQSLKSENNIANQITKLLEESSLSCI